MQSLIHFILCCFFIISSTNALSESFEWELLGPGDADQVTSLNVLENGDVVVGLDIAGIYISSNKGKSWNPINNGLNNLDVTTKVIQDKNNKSILFAGTRGGLYKSNDYGESWIRLSNGLPEAKTHSLSGSIGGILIDPFDSNIIYTAMGYRPSSEGTITVQKMKWTDTIYKSTNGGNSWKKIQAFPSATKVTQLYHSPTKVNTLYAATSSGIFISENAGKKWLNIFNNYTLNISIDAKNPKVIYAACNEKGLFKSADNGLNWREINSGLSFFDYRNKFKNRYSVITIDPRNSKTLYTINSTWGRAGGLYKSVDSGKHWNIITKEMPESWLKTSKRMNDIAISTLNTNQIYLGSSRYIYSSIDAGRTWKQNISKHIDNGWTHTGINVFGQTRVVTVDTENKNILYIGTADHKLLKSINQGRSWNQLLKNEKKANYVWDIDICPDKEHTINMVTSNNNKDVCYMSSNNKGKTWYKNCSFGDKAQWKEKIRVSPKDCNNLTLSTYNNLYKSSNAGKTWGKIDLIDPTLKVNAVEYSSNNMYIGTNKGLYIANYQGGNLRAIEETTHLIITSIHFVSNNKDEIFIGTRLSKKRPAEVYKSTDEGNSWHKSLGGLRKYVSSITSLPSNNNIIYIATLDDNYHDLSKGSGIYKSTDKGNTWKQIDKDLPVNRAYDITTSKLHPYTVFLATNGSGLYIMHEKNTFLEADSGNQ